MVFNPEDGTEFLLNFAAGSHALEGIVELADNLNNLVINIIDNLLHNNRGLFRLDALKEFCQGCTGLGTLILRLLYTFLFFQNILGQLQELLQEIGISPSHP